MDYRPDRGFVKMLKSRGEDYGARWDKSLERWRITYRGEPVMTVQNDDGTFRPLDERIIAQLDLTDAWKHGKRAILRALDEHNHRIKHRKRGPFRDMMHESSLDAWRKIKGGTQIQAGIDL